jgi:hypothetical protein
MYRRLNAISDTYITDKIISDKRKKEANVGQASTLDIFKLYNVTNSGSASEVVELSRALIKFDLSELRQLTGSILDYSHQSFKCHLKLFDVYHGNPTPSNFKIEVFPLSRSFSEGIGYDVKNFGDTDSSNFITASYSDVPTLWFGQGANKKGLLGSDDIDIISSGNLSDGNGLQNLFIEQTFESGTEDLVVDVTKIVSATLSGQLPDHGFRISLSSSLENDDYTYFVKRFASSNCSDETKKPKLLVKYNDTIQNHVSDFYFDLSGSVFLRSFGRSGNPKNLLSSSYQEATGSDSIILKLITTGSSGALITSSFVGSQHSIGNMFVTGVYSSSFALSSYESEYASLLKISSSISFEPMWLSADGTVAYHTGSLFKMKKLNKQSFINVNQRLVINTINLRSTYKQDDSPIIRIHVDDMLRKVVSSKIPIKRNSLIFTNLYYSIRDSMTNRVLVPFGTETNSTQLSVDEKGMYFKLYMSDFDLGKSYSIDIMIKDTNSEDVFTDVGGAFVVIK